MRICANVPKEVADYYQHYDLNKVVDILLDTYDITTLPPIDKSNQGKRVQLTIDITNEEYIAMYNFYGSRSVKISIARLLDFGYNMLILDNNVFESAIKKQKSVKTNDENNMIEYYLKQALSYINNAYKINKDEQLESIAIILNNYTELIELKRFT